ncbi:hypothetical protein MBLNU459_g8133t1 [Dothideomycetes sp. NU459]
MASGTYRNPDDHSPPHSVSDRRHSQASQMSNGYSTDPDYRPSSRSRASSSARSNASYNQAPPLDSAVNIAFDKSDAAKDLDPKLVAQITEQVINTLKATGVTGTAPAQSQQRKNGHSRSPTDSTTASIPARYTPPSPIRREESSYGSASPEPQWDSRDSNYFAPNNDTSRPRRSNSNASPSRGEDVRPRPRPVRIPTAVEEATTVEKVWQPLFDNGRPTARLGQFLRGLAIHVIEDYEPKNSIVVTPSKMMQFFDDFKVTNEVYPWRDIFGGKITNDSISRMYRDLRCQHHFVQLSSHSVPDIPGLTPVGFECWMTALIQAHPGLEYDRLAKAVLAMPISNADDCKERFPKELSRRLFPREDDRHWQQRLHAAISADRNIQLRNSNPMPPPPSTQPPSLSSSFAERERNPYSSSSFSSAFEDDDAPSTSIPLERERKPYTAKEGTGKIFAEDRPNGNPPRADTNTRPNRASSAAPAPSYHQTASRASDIPPPNNVRQQPAARPAEYSQPTGPRYHRLSSSGARPNFNAAFSSPISNTYTRSEGANVGDIPSSYYTSNIHSDLDDDLRRSSRRPTDDETYVNRQSYAAPPRAGVGAGYEYGSGPGPVPGTYDDPRRRNTAGSDGYGSYSTSYGGVLPPSRY